MARRKRYERQYPKLPHSYDEGQNTDDIVNLIKSLELSPSKTEALYKIIVLSSRSMRPGSGLLYSQLMNIVEFAMGGQLPGDLILSVPRREPDDKEF